jgi:hypothetical protein
MKPTTLLLSISLLILNLCFWNLGTIFLYSPPRKTLPPNPEIQMGRTADDIARGLIFALDSLSEPQKIELSPLFSRGSMLRQHIEAENQNYSKIQEQLLTQTQEVLENR